jgi:hypothetical protein
VRARDGRLFWPVLRPFGEKTTLKNFATGIAVGGTTLLRLMNSNIFMGYCFPKMSEEEFRREVPTRDIKLASRDRTWAGFGKGSRRMLIIDSVVHVEGREPLLFGSVDEDRLVFTIGPTDYQETYGSDHRISGAAKFTREVAACRGLA